MFIDEASFEIKAGKGGDGAVSFRRERFVPRGGPDGGDGGRGGDVEFVAKHDLHTLSSFRSKKVFAAEDGKNGSHKKMYGKGGDNLLIEVPLGTTIKIFADDDKTNPTTFVDMITDGQVFLAAKGGNGGWGNAHFATSIKQAPAWSKLGLVGQHFNVELILQLIADVGLVGQPNAGKSTLLATISNARPKIADYPFTTLEPQLGLVTFKQHNFVVADIPGLIEGASENKGLGIAFLKHIQRTRALLFILDANTDDPERAFDILKAELSSFNKDLASRPHIVVLNKVDLLDAPTRKILKKSFPDAQYISAATGEGIDDLLGKILHLLPGS